MTVEFSKREIGYMIWAMHTYSENPVIAKAVGKLLDTLKLGEKVKIISAERMEELEEELMKAVARKAVLEEKIKALESERDNLLAEVEALKAIPTLEVKVTALESEVTKLKEEKKALEEKSCAPPPAEVAPCEAVPAEAPAPSEEKPCGEKPCE